MKQKRNLIFNFVRNDKVGVFLVFDVEGALDITFRNFMSRLKDDEINIFTT